jgi:hypothetical protein
VVALGATGLDAAAIAITLRALRPAILAYN